jgi:hypothetical protein
MSEKNYPKYRQHLNLLMKRMSKELQFQYQASRNCAASRWRTARWAGSTRN